MPLFYVFRLWVKCFSVYGEQFSEKAVKMWVMHASKRALSRDDKFLRIINICGFWAWRWDCLTFGKKIAWFWKLLFTCPQDFFEENSLHEKPKNLIFPDLQRKILQSSVKLFLAFCQNAIDASSRSFGRIDEFWDELW